MFEDAFDTVLRADEVAGVEEADAFDTVLSGAVDMEVDNHEDAFDMAVFQSTVDMVARQPGRRSQPTPSADRPLAQVPCMERNPLP